MRGPSGSRLYIGELSLLPRNALLRKLQRHLAKLKTRLFYKKHLAAPGTACLAVEGAIEGKYCPPVDLKQERFVTIAMLMADGLKASGELVEAGERLEGLGHKGLNLAWAYREQVMFLLARFDKILRSVKQAVETAKPDTVVVHDARSLEGLALRAVQQQTNLGFRIISAVPTWFSLLEAGLFRLVRTAFLFRREGTLRFALARASRPGKEPDAGGEDVMAYCAGPVSTRGVLPVIRELLRRGETSLSVFSYSGVLPLIEACCREAGYELEAEKPFSSSSWIDILRFLPRQFKAMAALRASGADFMGVPVHAVIGLSRVQFSALSFVEAAAHYETCERKLRNRRPRAILVGNCAKWRFKILARILKRNGATSVFVQDGVIDAGNPVMVCSSSEHMCVGGRTVEETVRNLGLKATVHLTGLPMYDDFVSSPVRPREEVCRDLGLSETGLMILMTSHHNMDPAEKREAARSLLAWTGERPNARLVFKLHPYETDGIIEDIVRGSTLADRVKVVRDFATRDLLAAADLSVVRMGSCGIESVLVGTRVAEINFSGQPDDQNILSRAGIAPNAFTGAELRAILDGFEEETESGRPASGGADLAGYLGELDGLASKRCADVLDDIVRRQ